MTDDYLRAWLALGLPTPDASVGAERGEDEARYAVFVEWVQSNANLVEQFGPAVELVAFELDEEVQKSMYRRIIETCSREDLSKLLDIEEIKAWVEEEMLLRRLDDEVDEAELLQMLKTSSRKVQLKMVGRVALPPSVLQHLANEGVTKAIRNRAMRQLGAGR